MAQVETKAKRWRIGIRGVLYFTTAIAASMALMRFASTDYPAHWLLDAAHISAFFGSLSLFGGAIGGLLGHLLKGTRLALIEGMLIGGVLSNVCCCGLNIIGVGF